MDPSDSAIFSYSKVSSCISHLSNPYVQRFLFYLSVLHFLSVSECSNKIQHAIAFRFTVSSGHSTAIFSVEGHNVGHK